MAKRPPKPASLFDRMNDDTEVISRPPGGDENVSLHEAAQTRYLNYALSVITSRALPDVRDGLKPVQRRILFTMWQQNLTADVKHRKCAKVVGDVMGNYHPHGDSALYETLVRMAQPFSLRYPLVDGSGNFGSLDGDNAAAMRYTECRLARLSDEMLSEIDQDTVAFRPNYDGTKEEPVVLPARIPNLLVNGATGIAVGMATNIPPHNLSEVCTALVKMIDNDFELSNAKLCKYIKGPDFPTGGLIMNTPEEFAAIYHTGSGSIRLRATWTDGPSTRSGQTVYITSVPYAVNKSTLVERIADVALSRKLPHLLDVKDLSTDDVRIALELKGDANKQLVMAYLFKHTPLQTNFPVNLTCLVPTENPNACKPERLGLHEILWQFLHFRLEVVRARLKYELEALSRRIHILQGFEIVFDALDDILKIVRKSDGKQDSAQKIMAKFALDAGQTDAILELKIYRLARLEILVIQQELADKRKRAKEIGSLLKKEADLWQIVRTEIELVKKTYGDPRRSEITGEVDETEYTADDFIIDEENVVLISRDGWVKRQKEVKDISSTRLREGDSILAVLPGSTKATVVFFTNFGVAYTAKIADIPASTGYGEPIQSLFKFKDGEKVVAALSLDPRVAGEIRPRESFSSPEKSKTTPEVVSIPPVHALAVSSDGYSLRFSLEPFFEPSTKAGRRFARLAGAPAGTGSEIVGVARITGDEIVIAATRQARAMLCKVEDINFLSGPGRGVILIKLQPEDDRLLGFIASTGDRDLMTVETTRGAEQTISTTKYAVTGRGGRGRELMQRGEFTRVIPQPVELPAGPV
jgi:DNA gyrase subunit A